ncbi:uncharacterized protein TNCV_4845601 [Trichonephila clavipes]|uniref:Uncharacterized protein n=1 Tax=Trichonephila clavipes TaxID=2585209 RepID=A0A8X6WJE9_TRICX|nr:uncharacterized protein TNCV_4845601 [Trichonephila clavipes]
MAFILKDSPECVKSELELFNLPGTQTVIQDGQWKQFHPLSNVFDNAPVEFHISGSAEDYIDLSQTQLYVKAKIVKVDNTPITKDDTIGPDSDDGLKKRTEFFKESATVDMIGCIHSDLFHQDRLLLNLVDLKIKLIRSKPEFCLQGSEGFKVVLDHVSLFIRKVRVNPGVILVEYFLMVFDGLEQIGLGTEHMALGVIVHCWDSGLRRQWVCSLNGLDETPLFIF